MDAILDTEQLRRDLTLTAVATHVLFDSMEDVGVRVFVPEVVVVEAAGHLHRAHLEVNEKLEDLRNHFRIATGEALDEALLTRVRLSVVEDPRTTEDRLRRKLTHRGARLLPWPDIRHEELVRRAASRKRPFREGKGGYRDALIWSSVVRHLQGSDLPCALVTNNHKDFEDGASRVHPDLLADLLDAGVGAERLLVVRSIREFNDQYVLPHLKATDPVRAQLKRGSYRGIELNEWLAAHWGEIVGAPELEGSADAPGGPPRQWSRIAPEAEHVLSFDVGTVGSLHSGATVADVAWTVVAHASPSLTTLRAYRSGQLELPVEDWRDWWARWRTDEHLTVRVQLLLSDTGITEWSVTGCDGPGKPSKR